MTALALLAALTLGTNSVSFTVTATGVAPKTPLEFAFAGKTSDRDYESLFLLDDSPAELVRALESAGLKRGKPIDLATCRLWPVGQEVVFTPALSEYLISEPLMEGGRYPTFRYTGGARGKDGACLANDEMPQAVLALFDCPQSLFQYGGSYPQGVVYGRHTPRRQLKKGERVTFRVSWSTEPTVASLDVTVRPGQAKEALEKIRENAERGEIEVCVGFDPNLTVAEATAFAQALAVVDSIHIKVNGRHANDFFYRAFLPLVKWRDRRERLTQPFEVTVPTEGENRFVFVEEDWTVDGSDPKLTPRPIAPDRLAEHPKTDTCFFYTPPSTKLERLQKVLKQLPSTVVNAYVFGEWNGK